MKKILKDLKKKITLFAVVMLVLQPMLGLALLPTKTFAAVYGASVTDFTLVNADTNLDIGPLTNDMIINLASEDHLNVRANTSPAIVGSVKFGLDANANYRNETATPYALAGDTAGNYFVWTPSVGSHTVTATPYSGSGGTGDAGTLLSVTFTVIDAPIVTEVTPVTTPTNDATPSYTFNSTRAGTISYGGDCSRSTTAAVAGNNTIIFNALADGLHSNCTISVVDGGGNVSLPLGVSSFTVDTTGPSFGWTAIPPVAGPITPVKITIGIVGNETLTPMSGVPSTTLENGKEVHVLDAGACASYDILLTIHDADNPYRVCLNKDPNGEYTHTYNIGSYVGPEKMITFSMTAQDALGNKNTDDSGIFKASNVVLSPVVETPQATLAVATVTPTAPPVVQNDQFGGTGDGSSEGGEVKADTVVKADDGNNGENKDEQKEDTKEKKNIPLWGIIFLLILAGVGGYLFYSQSPEKGNGKK